MKSNKLVTAATAILMTISSASYAQPGPKPERGMKALQQVSVFTGKVGEWVNNDNYVYDGFYLQTGSEKLLVKFPPHMGRQLLAVLKNGSNINVNGVQVFSPMGEKEIRMISVTSGGQIINDAPPVEPITPLVEELITSSSRIKELQKNKQGEVNGFILDNMVILRLPPHVAMQLSQLAVPNASISYTGIKKSIHNGEATAANYTIIHCNTITINNTQYLTR